MRSRRREQASENTYAHPNVCGIGVEGENGSVFGSVTRWLSVQTYAMLGPRILMREHPARLPPRVRESEREASRFIVCAVCTLITFFTPQRNASYASLMENPPSTFFPYCQAPISAPPAHQ